MQLSAAPYQPHSALYRGGLTPPIKAAHLAQKLVHTSSGITRPPTPSLREAREHLHRPGEHQPERLARAHNNTFNCFVQRGGKLCLHLYPSALARSLLWNPLRHRTSALRALRSQNGATAAAKRPFLFLALPGQEPHDGIGGRNSYLARVHLKHTPSERSACDHRAAPSGSLQARTPCATAVPAPIRQVLPAMPARKRRWAPSLLPS